MPDIATELKTLRIGMKTACTMAVVWFALLAVGASSSQSAEPGNDAVRLVLEKANRLFELGSFEDAAERYAYLLSPDLEPPLADPA